MCEYTNEFAMWEYSDGEGKRDIFVNAKKYKELININEKHAFMGTHVVYIRM